MAADRGNQQPKAVIHKRILEKANDQPDTSIGGLAEDIPGASIDLVEKVLEEYGDPAEASHQDLASESSVETTNQPEPPATTESKEDPDMPSPEELTAVQRETLCKIDEEPTATQEEIGQTMGVTGATICNRLSDIAGFSWQDRQEYVSNLFGPPLISDGHGQIEQDASANNNTQLSDIEERLDELESSQSTHQPPLPIELAHKVIHACMKSDEISEDEELELIRALVG